MYKFFLICNNKNIQKNQTKQGGNQMKATGVVRRIDDLGRVVIPKEIRKTLRIKEGEPLEIFTDREGQVILKNIHLLVNYLNLLLDMLKLCQKQLVI